MPLSFKLGKHVEVLMVGNDNDSRYGHLDKGEIETLIAKYEEAVKALSGDKKKVTTRRLRQLHEELRRKN